MLCQQLSTSALRAGLYASAMRSHGLLQPPSLDDAIALCLVPCQPSITEGYKIGGIITIFPSFHLCPRDR